VSRTELLWGCWAQKTPAGRLESLVLSEANSGKSSVMAGLKMPKATDKEKERVKWMFECDNPTPLAFYRFINPTHKSRAIEKYLNTINSVLERNRKNKAIQKKLTAIRKKFDDGEYKQDWEVWMQEKRAAQVHCSIQKTNINVHKKFNSLVESQSVDVKQDEGEADDDQDRERDDQRSQIENGSDAVAVKSAGKKNKIQELFNDMKKCNIYMLCEPFGEKSRMDAGDFFESIVRNTTVEVDIPKDIKKYLSILLTEEDVENALSKVKEPLNSDACPLLLWTSEICRHFIFYFYYGGLQIDGDEKTWSNQTVYRILDLFSMFFGKLTSGIALGEIVNEAHKDRIYNINVDQIPLSSRKNCKNDAVLYQDGNATVVYEQSYGPTEFDSTHYLRDIRKLARNGVDDLNYHFSQYGKSSIATAKKLKSIAFMFLEYFISIYLTDLICMKTYRIYEVLKCKIPTTYTDRWLLFKIANIGALLEKLLKERQSVKGEMGKEDSINENGSDCVHNWLSIPDNISKTQRN
ncbi:27703_t:CDS:2, partial [Dentiscutata erythropus]